MKTISYIMCSALCLSVSVAGAQAPTTTQTPTTTQLPAAGQTPPTAKKMTEEMPMYVSARLAMVVPASASEDTYAIGGGMGIVDKHGSLFGLRVIWLPDPPENHISTNQAKINSAWGPVMEWQHAFTPRGRVTFYSNVAAGFVYGTPVKQKNEDGSTEKHRNVILPMLELGVGLRVSGPSIAGQRFFIAPELGYVPAGRAPYTAVTFGVY